MTVAKFARFTVLAAMLGLAGVAPNWQSTAHAATSNGRPGLPPSDKDLADLMAAGEAAIAAENWERAFQIYTVAISTVGPQGDRVILGDAFTGLGLAYRGRGDFGKAILAFTEALRHVPAFYEALVYRGESYVERRSFARAEADFAAAIRLDNSFPQAYNSRATSFYARGLFRRAEEDCRTSLRIEPDDPHCYELLARMHNISGDYAAAIADATSGIRIAPDDPNNYYARGVVYFASTQYERAIADFDSALKLAPSLAEALYARGVARMRLGQNGNADIARATNLQAKVAERMFPLGISPSPRRPGIDDLAACKMAEMNNEEILGALFFCNRAFSTANLSSADRGAASAVLGRLYYKSGDWEEAITHLSRAIQLAPGDRIILAMRGAAYAQSGYKDEAVADLNAAIQASNSVAELRMLRGAYYEGIGQREQALDDYSEVIRLEPNSATGYFARASLYEESDQFNDAIADLNVVVRLEPKAETYAMRCAVLAYAGQLTAAMGDCEKALIEHPDNGAALSTRGLIYLGLGQDTKAAEDFEHALETDPDTVLAYYGLGLIKLRHGDRTGEEDIAEAVRLDADSVARLRRRGIRP